MFMRFESVTYGLRLSFINNLSGVGRIREDVVDVVTE